MDPAWLMLSTAVLGFLVWLAVDKFNLYYIIFKPADPHSSSHGGELVAQVLQAAGVRHVFTLVGGHISPILVACENAGIRVVDTRHEATAVFAADAVGRLSGGVGVAAVTAGPGLTNAVTAMKNAQMAESPVLLLAGAAATLLKGRGALQDIDQLSVMSSVCKWTASVRRVRDIVPTVRRAVEEALGGTPGPVFVELPIDVLYKYSLVEREAKGPSSSSSKSLLQRLVDLYLRYHLNSLFAGGFDDVNVAPFVIKPLLASTKEVQRAVDLLSAAKRPVILLGSQVTLPPTPLENLAGNLEKLGIPCFLGGMSRGLLGRDSAVQVRQKRRQALKEADAVLMLGAVCDFRLGYGRALPRRATIVVVNREKNQLFRNSDLFWKPTLAIQADAASTLVSIAQRLTDYRPDPDWLPSLKRRDAETEAANVVKAAVSTADGRLNPVAVLQRLEASLPDDAIIVADGGDFVGTAAYILRPRAPLSWLDPGAFGTLGVGAGFALGAKLTMPDKQVWIVYGDGSLGYSIIEFDTFKRFKVPVIAVVGNDACWSQIAREQVPLLGSNTACALDYTPYHEAAAALGARGVALDAGADEAEMDRAFSEASEACRGGRSVLVNVVIGKSDFREGSISV